MLSAARRARLETLFQNAAFDSSQWDAAVTELAAQTGSSHGELIGIGGGSFIPFHFAPTLPRRALDDLAAIGGWSPRLNYRVAAAAPRGSLVTEDDYDAVHARIGWTDCDDIISDHDVADGMQMTLLDLPCGGVVGLTVLRSGADGRSTAEQRQAFADIAPRAAAAVRIAIALDHQAASIAAGALEATDSMAILLDRRGIVQGMTGRAEQLVLEDMVVRVEAGRLAAVHPRSRKAFADALARALGPKADRLAHSAIPIQRADGGMLAANFVSLPVDKWSLGYRPRVIVTFRAAGPTRADLALLRLAYDMTPSEAEVAMLLASGHSRAEIAQLREVSPSTVQEQFKAIFGKVGRSREAAVVAAIRDVLG